MKWITINIQPFIQESIYGLRTNKSKTLPSQVWHISAIDANEICHTYATEAKTLKVL